MSSTVCPHCQNTMGFVFGTCCNCGWNSIDHTFHFVQVSLEDVPSLDPYLLAKHAARTKREPKPPTPLKE